MVFSLKGHITGNIVYEKNSKNSIEIKGSDTLLQLVSNLAESYSADSLNARISVTGGGSGTGIAALINGEVDIADASRRIKDKEIAEAKERGINPLEFIIARDMLSVIVNEENSISKLTVEEIGKIYKGEITNWKDIGGADKQITLYGRQSTSGTYDFFMETVLEDDYSPEMRNLESNKAILESVKQDKTGVGYVGIGYVKDEFGNQVKGINIIRVSNGIDYILPLDKTKIADYPISRPLYQYFAKKPKQGEVNYDFLMFELSDKGQKIVEKTGFVKILDDDKSHNNEMLKRL